MHATPLVQADAHSRVEGLLELLPFLIDPLLEAQPVRHGAVPLLGVESGRWSGLAVADVAERVHAGVEVVPRRGHVVHPPILAAFAPVAKEAAGAVGAVDPRDPHRVRVEERHEAEVPAHLRGVLLGGEVAALIVQVPVARPERFRAPVRTAFSGQVGVVGAVAVLDPVMEVGDAAVAERHAQVGLCADALAHVQELVRAHGVVFGREGQVVAAGEPLVRLAQRPLGTGADPIAPLVVLGLIARRPLQHADAGAAHRLDQIGAEAAFVGDRRGGLHHPVAAAREQAPVEVRTDGADRVVDVDVDDVHSGSPWGAAVPL